MANKKVFVSGCYDMLHSGHIAFFKAAANYGDLGTVRDGPTAKFWSILSSPLLSGKNSKNKLI